MYFKSETAFAGIGLLEWDLGEFRGLEKRSEVGVGLAKAELLKGLLVGSEGLVPAKQRYQCIS